MRERWTTIFTKLPRAGEVKTRLCPPLAPEQAARLSEAMLADRVASCAASHAFRTRLCVHPPGSEAWFAARFPAVASIEAQEGDGLGTRLARHFERHAPLVVVGSDAPEVPVERIVEAHERLAAGSELVLGPDAGGGYYLVGLGAPCAELFTEVAMSEPGMYARTLARARALELSVAELEPGHDVDTPHDLARLVARARAGAGPGLAHVRAWLRGLGPQGASLTAVP